MADINTAIKKVIKESMESAGLTDYRAGTVIATGPLRIKISDKIILDENQLYLSEQVIEKVICIRHTHEVIGNTQSADGHSHGVNITSQEKLAQKIIIIQGLAVGDKVHLIATESRQKYIVLSKIRECKKISIDGHSGGWSFS